MVAYFSGCGCRRRVREHGDGAVGFSDAEPGGERGWKWRHDGWSNVLQQCEWLLGRSGDDDGQHDLLLQCEWLRYRNRHEDRQIGSAEEVS